MAPNCRERILALSITSLVLLHLASCGGGAESPSEPDEQVASVSVSPEQFDLCGTDPAVNGDSTKSIGLSTDRAFHNLGQL